MGKYYKKSRLLALSLVILAAVSCTYDYFVDETNFKIYIPQIKEGSIENVLVSIHDASGKHCYTVFKEAPFDPSTVGKDGILRFKLPWGPDYKVSCFANIDKNSYVVGQSYDNSYISELPGGDLSSLAGPDFRVVLQDGITAYPIERPEGQKLDTVNLDNSCVYKGHISCEFRNLPSIITQIDIKYKGVGTRMYYDGSYRNPDDRYVACSYLRLEGANVVTGPTALFPSSGTHYLNATTEQREPLSLEIRYRSSDGADLGVTTVPQSGGATPPQITDDQGHIIEWDGYLNPKQHLKFIFEGFVLIKIELVGWGDIEQGDTTPM